MDLLPLQFGFPGGVELLVVVLIAVLLFGADKVPKLARSTGEAMGEFQKGREEIEEELKEVRGDSGSSSPQTAVDRAVAETKQAESSSTSTGGSDGADAAEADEQTDEPAETDADADDQSDPDDTDDPVDIADAESETN